MKKLAWILGFATMMPMMVNAEQASVQQVQAEKAAGIWIDVRSAEEFQQGHLKGAINLTHTEIAQRIAEVAPDKDQPINLYCRSGRRAEVALNELKKLGYSNVTNHGGYDDLIKAGLK
ncbi:TPA: rhodanese-like domain-containing protein [Pasteurella multocida]|nr:rhodanese-like domain-containing protein [Pasteurella multocida]AWW59652.1 rhodanese-like domain-containing protein [Pasteurellaceae bacterium 12591]EGP03332.1 periplasmic protein [Pasteurella multocida subsp. gallicida str. Anand1_poultry]AET15700.1 putative rhodanese domain sulfurtransferase [Pasteurella multocida 36950]ANJ89956.1 putative rhodanese domain sulfurtransferase [Pasteurella multocida subsp. multocida HB01]AON57717.1 rhodanese-like domain-containing protein [Pasteurella multoc